MNKTIYINSGKLNDHSFFIDVLYYSGTSYSKSLYPTISRLFKKYAMEYMNGGSYESKEQNIDIQESLITGYHAHTPYYIKRTIYTSIHY